MNEDAELLRCYARFRSESAFAELVQRRIGLVYSVALRRTRDAHLAEDAAQAVFADLARKAASLPADTVLAGWLYRSAHYAATNIMRAEESRVAREQEAQRMQAISADDRPPDTWEKIKPLLDEVMSELDEPDRDAILLRFFDGRSFAEVGAQLQLTENAARMRVDRALDKLHAAFARRDIKSTTAVLGVVFAQHAMASVPAGLAASVTSGALASVAVTTAPALTFFQIMTTTKMVAGLAGVALSIAVLGTAYETQARRSAETTLASAMQERVALAERLRDLEQRVQAADAESARLKKAAEEAASARAAAKAKAAAESVAKAAGVWDPVAEGRAFLERHPDLKQALADSTDADTRFTFSGIYASLELTPTQIERFEALMREGAGRGIPLEGQWAMLSPGTGMPMGELPSAMIALLGAEKFRKLWNYGRTAPDRRLATEVAGALCFSETPLLPTQSDQLVQIIAGSRARGPNDLPGEVDWRAVVIKARDVLSAPQLAVVESMYPQVAEQALYLPKSAEPID